MLLLIIGTLNIVCNTRLYILIVTLLLIGTLNIVCVTRYNINSNTITNRDFKFIYNTR